MRSSEELVTRLGELARDRARLEAAEAATLLELEEVRRVETAHLPAAVREAEQSVVADEVAVAWGVSTQVVQQRRRDARMVAERLPSLWAAHREGRVDAWRVRIVAQTAYALTRSASLQQLDEQVADRAARSTPARLRAWLRRFVARVEPDQVAERRRASVAERRVWFEPAENGTAWLCALLRAEDAALADRALTLAAKTAVEAGDDTDGRIVDRTVAQTRADVLADRLLGRTAGSPGPGRFHIGVTVPLTTLLGLATDPAESSDGSFVLPPAALRELATEPGTLFSRLLTDPLGGVLDVTELGRFPSARLRRALNLIDGTCAFPTCEAPAVSADADHIEAHPDGPTRGRNLICLCRRHHRLKTLGALGTTVGPGGRHTWRLRTGRMVPSVTHRTRVFVPSRRDDLPRLRPRVDMAYQPSTAA